MGKKHGTLTKAGKVILLIRWFIYKQVRKATPKVKKREETDNIKKRVKGRAWKRILYTRRYINVTKLPNGRVRSPNFNAGRGDEDLAR